MTIVLFVIHLVNHYLYLEKELDMYLLIQKLVIVLIYIKQYVEQEEV